MANIKDITGQRFGRLVVTGYADKGHYNCLCDCGEVRRVLRQNLVSGRQMSCGCYAKDRKKERMLTHGMTNTPLYNVWNSMRNRCNNQNVDCYASYGGRGLTVCAEWQNDFQAFYDWAIKNGWKQGLQIDRISNEDGYNPQNCRIVTQAENENNRRDNRIIEYKGKKYTVTQLANEFGFDRRLIYNRIFRLGWSVEDAIKIKPEKGNNQNLRKEKTT